MTTATKTREWSYPYDPSTKQQQAGAALVDELLFGGAAGGGKSEYLLAACVNTALAIPGCKVILLRRTFPEIEQEIEPRLLERIPPSVGRYNGGKHTWIFNNRSRLILAYLQTDKDVYRYLGAEYVLIAWDELTLFRRRDYVLMKGRLRAAGKVAAALRSYGMRPRMIAATNPGGPGHGWVKERFIDPVPQATPFPIVDETGTPTGETGMYLRSLPSDNPHLDLEDYNRKLAGMDEVMRRAYKEGDWDILDGVRFPQWRRSTHVITPDQCPDLTGYPRAMGVDYGMDAPFAAVWGALLPDNLVIIYRELYVKNLSPRQQAQLILDSEDEDERHPTRPIPIALDPACWARAASNPVGKNPNPNAPPPGSIAHTYRQVLGSGVVKARNERIGGWALLDDHLAVRADGLPRLLVLDTCPHTIRTLPSVPRSRTNPQDVDTYAEDHLPDAIRYLLQQLAGGGASRTAPDPLAARPGPALTAGLATKTW